MATLYAPGTSGVGTRARAKSWIDKAFTPGWCLYWCLVHVFRVPGLGDYDHDGSADAEDYWKAAKKRGKVVETSNPKDIPKGVLIMWTGGSRDHGHAAYSLGNGEMVSTDLPTRGKVGRVPISKARSQWGLTLVGYVLVDGNGFTLVKPDPVSEPTPLPAPVKYLVTAETGLIGRAGPGTSFAQKWLAKYDSTVEAVATNEGEGRDWVVTKSGTHYALEYLQLKE